MVAVKMVPFLEPKMKEKQRAAGGDKKSNQFKKSVQENFPEPILAHQSRDDAGALVGVSGRSVSDAKRVVEKGAPGLKEMVEDGSVSGPRIRRRAPKNIDG
jgi:hypothetical protein